MVNNFELIKGLLQFNHEGDFYFIQILKRRKDNTGMEVDMRVINNYFIYSERQLMEDLQQRIIEECNFHNARAYIRVNVRNAEKIALQTLKKVTDMIISKDYKAVKNAYLSAAGEHHSQVPKRWIVDIDGSDWIDTFAMYTDMINGCQPLGNKVIGCIPTKNGYHIICTPFNLQEWNKLFKEPFTPIDIHKDNPTLLYCPSSNTIKRQYRPCGDCGATEPLQRCLGCRHEF